jgi:hypothetical protein
MSELANAVFGGQLTGHALGGEELTTSVVTNAAITADLASNLVHGEDGLSGVEAEILRAKIVQHVVSEGDYSPQSIIQDQLEAQIEADVIDGIIG